jgi:hypothetical protein
MNALSQIDICELRTINQKLKILQDKLLSEAIKLDKALHVRVEDKNDLLDDYEIQIKVCFVLKEDHPNFKENDDNIVTQIHEYLTNISKDAPSYPWRWNDNHNEYRGWRDHPLKDEHHCWWFHCLYDHNNLEFSDILTIGSIWSDINVYYQYYDSLK